MHQEKAGFRRGRLLSILLIGFPDGFARHYALLNVISCRLVDGDFRIGTVAKCVAVELAGQPLEIFGGIHRIPQGLAANVQVAAFFNGHLVDGLQDDHGRVIGVTMERRDGFFTIFFLMGFQEALISTREC